VRAGFLAILVLVGVASAGCGAAAQQAAPVSSHAVVSAAAFGERGLTQAAGVPVVAARKAGVSLHAVPGGTFGLMLVLRNQTHRRLTLENVQAVVPHASFVRQRGTHLAPFFQCHPYCSRHMVMRGPFPPVQPRALLVRPYHSAQAQLNFVFAACGALRTAAATPITRAILTYRDASGGEFRQTLVLRSAQLDLQRSGRIACRA
jgi:hypothetical protein